jgi:quinol monooxygenase YgiN
MAIPSLADEPSSAASSSVRHWELSMTAFNAVRFRVKPGREQEFLDAHKKVETDWPGLKHVNIIKTGERSYCIIAEWEDMDALAKARPNMIATLDSFRDTLEDLGGGLGVTDPVAGPVVLALK